MIKIDLADSNVRSAVERLLARTQNSRPAFFAIGELVAESTKQRFVAGRGPDGNPWAPNSPTIEHYVRQRSGLFDKVTGKRTGTKMSFTGRAGERKKAAIAAAKKPLHGLTGLLAEQIFYNVVSDGVEVGSPMIYSAMQQFGGKKSAFPHLWGDIPARPFLGLSPSDEQSILDVIEEFLSL